MKKNHTHIHINSIDNLLLPLRKQRRGGGKKTADDNDFICCFNNNINTLLLNDEHVFLLDFREAPAILLAFSHFSYSTRMP